MSRANISFLLKFSLLFIFLILTKVTLYSQTGVIKGRVYNEKNNEPMPFVNIIISGTTIGSTSDFDGNFIFKGLEPGNVKLEASFVGFERVLTEEIRVTNARNANIDIGMREEQFQLEEVVIEASPFQEREESPLSLRRISASEIDANPGSNRDISRAIQALPGVAFTPAFRNDVIIRGGGPNENSFFIDGVEIPNINHFATQGSGGGPVGIINVDFIREVEMYSSAFPANRGDALSSVFEFRQIRGCDERLNYRATLGASDLALTIDGPISDNTTMIFSARRSYLQFLFALLELPFLPTYNSFQFKTDTKLDEVTDLTFIGIGAIDQFNLNLDANDTDLQRYILDYLPVNEQWNYSLGGVYRTFRNDGFDRIIISRNMLRNFSYKYEDNDENNPRTFDYESDEIENKIRYERVTEVGEYRLMYGAGGEYARYLNNTYRQVFFNNEISEVSYNSSLDIFKYSAFSQISRRFIDSRLSLSLGIRTDANSYSSIMANPLDQLSPRISSSYNLTDQTSINSSVGRYYQLPPYTTMGFRDEDGLLINKNNNLSYISSDHYILGISHFPARLSKISIEGFYKTYDNYPFSLSDSVPIGAKPVDFGAFGDEEVSSISTGRAFGGELLYREQRFEGLNVILSYTFVRSEFKDIRNNDYIPSSWDNRHIINLTATQELPNNWDVGFKWRFSGGAPYTPYDLELSSQRDAWDIKRQGYLDYNNFNAERLPLYHQLDLRVDKKYFFNNYSLMLYVDIQNVYNFQQELAPFLIRETDELGNPLPAETINGEEVYSLKKLENKAGNILPSIGIMIEF